MTWSRPAQPVVVAGDATMLSHLLGNVIGNAVEAAGPGGDVRIKLEEPNPPTPFPGKEGGAREPSSAFGPSPFRGGVGEGLRFVRVEVSDSGPGPPPGIADTLFDPFVTGKDQGIGLGLAVAKQAADAHGGSVRWERKDGRTVFVIELSN